MFYIYIFLIKEYSSKTLKVLSTGLWGPTETPVGRLPFAVKEQQEPKGAGNWGRAGGGSGFIDVESGPTASKQEEKSVYRDAYCIQSKHGYHPQVHAGEAGSNLSQKVKSL